MTADQFEMLPVNTRDMLEELVLTLLFHQIEP